MYVKCLFDDNEKYPRDFIMGQIKKIDDFLELADIDFFDVTGISEYYDLPERMKVALDKVVRMKIRTGARVQYKYKTYVVRACLSKQEDDFYSYYIQSDFDEIEKVSEEEICVSYNDGYIFPLDQLKKYEFHNPIWFLGRTVVSSNMNIINNSLYGFRDIAGCKISLKTHQLRTLIRCLQENNCRYMLADEVGMGKTIEAASVLKVYLDENKNKNIIIVVPDTLIEQWKTELAFKFKILEGYDVNDNYICIIGISDAVIMENGEYDFVIVDEVHNYIQNEDYYDYILMLSKNTENILLLSATPVQRREEEYLKLLTLIQPDKYERMSRKHFNELLASQIDIVRKTHTVLENLDSLQDDLENGDFILNEDIVDSFEDVMDSLESLNENLNDERFEKICNRITLDDYDFGVGKIQLAVAYVCENYQYEKSIIRNRKNIGMDDDSDEDNNERDFIDISYDIQTEFNDLEYLIYNKLCEWLEERKITFDSFSKDYKRLITSFFSSASAFFKEVDNIFDSGDELFLLAEKWKVEEEKRIINISDYLENPDEYASRINNIIDYIDQELFGKKVLIFTEFDETFDLYKTVMLNYFGEEHCAFFNRKMDKDNRELNSYRFETDKDYWILLSDSSGGEGRNFQNADAVLHIDLPWNANSIEQRIGRLDRIGRKSNKPVISVVCYANGSMEEGLFKFWNEGIEIFTKSQSGLEIIMNEMDERIIKTVCDNFKYGLLDVIDDIKAEVKNLNSIVREERYFDIAEYKYQNVNRIMKDIRKKYLSNEKKIFSDSMMNWATVVGFKGAVINDDTIVFNASSFSVNSASKAIFVPPDIRAMIDNKINQMQNRMRMLNDEKVRYVDTNYIQGTFDRKKALENDYIHFFAPGDPIYDSIVNNALNSYKGSCAAFSIKASIDWQGIICTWSLKPDEKALLEKGLPIHMIDKYRGFMPIEQIRYAVGIRKDESVSNEDALKEYNKFLNHNLSWKSECFHLGKRTGPNPSIEQFMMAFPPERWNSIVSYSYDVAHKEVINIIKENLSKKLTKLKYELSNDVGAKKARDKKYDESEYEKAKEINQTIYNCFCKPQIILDSICYVRMIKNDK